MKRLTICYLVVVSIVALVGCSYGKPDSIKIQPDQEEQTEITSIPTESRVLEDLSSMGLQEFYENDGREIIYCQSGKDLAFVLVKEPEISAGWTGEFIDVTGKTYAMPYRFFRIPNEVVFSDVNRLEVIGDIGRPDYKDYDFPDRIIFVRMATGEYYEDREPYYAAIDEENIVGSLSLDKIPSILIDFWFTSTGIELSYGPEPGHELAFYADYTKAPIHEFERDSDNNQFIITVHNVRHEFIANHFDNDPSCAVTGALFETADNDLRIILQLNKSVEKYNVSTHSYEFTRTGPSTPCVNINFIR